MIEVHITGVKHRSNATGKYDEKTENVTVLKGSVVSEDVKVFAASEKIIELRKRYVDENGIVIKNVLFDNPTAAAQFVCGYSVSGPGAWYIEKGKNLAKWKQERNR